MVGGPWSAQLRSDRGEGSVDVDPPRPPSPRRGHCRFKAAANSATLLAQRLEEARLAKRRKPEPEAGARSARVLRYSLDRYLEAGAQGAGEGLGGHVRRAVAERARFEAMVAAGAFELAYQPVVSLRDGRLHHFEALARFEPGASPAGAIRFAEELDLILGFDLAAAARVVGALQAEPHARIAVNVSALSLMTPAFLKAFGAIAGLSAVCGRLMVEVTETQGLGDLERADAVIGALRRLGCEVCLDDFGAGAATLEYLRRLDVDYVKIDGRYVEEAEANPRDALILKHLAALCRDLSVRTIAEKVETGGTAALLRGLGVDFAQGFAYSRPLAAPRWDG